jgi:predicted alpha/beta superfamily hydrolase
MARVGAEQPFTLPYARMFDVTSATGLEYRIFVGLPPSFGSDDRTYPALYVLDADSWFGTVLEISRSRSYAGEIGEILVIGVGYPTGYDIAVQTERRTYDFSSSEWDPDSALYREAAAVFETLGKEFRFGGAPAFVDFIADELQPLIAERYQGDPADRGIFGHSAGGNFVGHALFSRPDAFTKYISACPGFSFNDWDVFRLEEEYAAAHDDLPVTLYLAAGEGEVLQFGKFGLLSGTARMAESLHSRGYPNLKLTCEFLAGKTHETAVTEILQRGLEIFWPGTPYWWSAERVAENLRALQPTK